MQPRSDLLPTLTPLRFPIAIVIFVAHAWGVLKGRNGAEWAPWTMHAAAGLTMFFVLSGFILTYNYLEELRRPTFRTVWNFYVARWARTYPVYFISLFFLFPVFYSAIMGGKFGNPRSIFAVHLIVGQSWWSEDLPKANSLNPPSWSLSSEWFFYLLMPFLIPALTTGSRARRAAVLALTLAPWLIAVAGTAGVLTFPKWFNAYRYPPVRMIDFVSGVLLGMLWRRQYGGTVPKVKSFGLATVAEVGSVLFLCAWMWGIAVGITDVKSAHAARWNGIYIPPLLLLIWVLAHNGGLVSRVLTWRPVAYFGDLSYAFYMIHWSVLLTFAVYMHRFGGNKWGYGWRWAATGAASVLLTVLCYHLYEVPVREWLRRKLLIRRKPAAPAENKPADAANSPQPGVLPFPAPKPGERAA